MVDSEKVGEDRAEMWRRKRGSQGAAAAEAVGGMLNDSPTSEERRQGRRFERRLERNSG